MQYYEGKYLVQDRNLSQFFCALIAQADEYMYMYHMNSNTLSQPSMPVKELHVAMICTTSYTTCLSRYVDTQGEK